MKFPRFVSSHMLAGLELEHPSAELSVFLTRELRRKFASAGESADAFDLVRMNYWINRSRNLAAESIYVLEIAESGAAPTPAELAWHWGQFELLFRRLDTLQFVELLGEMIEERVFTIAWTNRQLEADGVGFQFVSDERVRSRSIQLRDVLELEELAKTQPQWQQNLRLLVRRMDVAAVAADVGATLRAGAAVWETAARELLGLSGARLEALRHFSERQRRVVELPPTIAGVLLDACDKGIVAPLAELEALAASTELTAAELSALVELIRGFASVAFGLKRACAAAKAPHFAAAPVVAASRASPAPSLPPSITPPPPSVRATLPPPLPAARTTRPSAPVVCASVEAGVASVASGSMPSMASIPSITIEG